MLSGLSCVKDDNRGQNAAFFPYKNKSENMISKVKWAVTNQAKKHTATIGTKMTRWGFSCLASFCLSKPCELGWCCYGSSTGQLLIVSVNIQELCRTKAPRLVALPGKGQLSQWLCRDWLNNTSWQGWQQHCQIIWPLGTFKITTTRLGFPWVYLSHGSLTIEWFFEQTAVGVGKILLLLVWSLGMFICPAWLAHQRRQQSHTAGFKSLPLKLNIAFHQHPGTSRGPHAAYLIRFTLEVQASSRGQWLS